MASLSSDVRPRTSFRRKPSSAILFLYKCKYIFFCVLFVFFKSVVFFLCKSGRVKGESWNNEHWLESPDKVIHNQSSIIIIIIIIFF
jgi:hypothetical protein